MLRICACASQTGKTTRHGLLPVQGPVSSRQRAEEWQLPPFGANDSASERHAAAGCSVRGEAANGLAARARYRCRACDAREVRARMLGMYCAHPEIPCLDVLRQAPASSSTSRNQVEMHVQGGSARVLHAPRAWLSRAGRWAAREAAPCRAVHGLPCAAMAAPVREGPKGGQGGQLWVPGSLSSAT